MSETEGRGWVVRAWIPVEGGLAAEAFGPVGPIFASAALAGEVASLLAAAARQPTAGPPAAPAACLVVCVRPDGTVSVVSFVEPEGDARFDDWVAQRPELAERLDRWRLLAAEVRA